MMVVYTKVFVVNSRGELLPWESIRSGTCFLT